jgi:hypothetical protein
MGQLLVTLIVPPIVGLVTYIIVRRIWERDENGPEAVSRREPSAVAQAEEKSNGAEAKCDVCSTSASGHCRLRTFKDFGFDVLPR